MKQETDNGSIRHFAPAVVWGIFIFALSVWPGKDFPQLDWGDLLSLDKIVHVAFYALLVVLILRGVKMSNSRLQMSDSTSSDIRHSTSKMSIGLILITATACMGYGWFLEWFQKNYCQDRMFDILDGVANMIGAYGAGIFYIVRNKRQDSIK